MESTGASAADLEAFLGTGRAWKGAIDGDLVNGEVYCGAIAGMITGIMSAAEIVKSITRGSEAVISRLNEFWS